MFFLFIQKYLFFGRSKDLWDEYEVQCQDERLRRGPEYQKIVLLKKIVGLSVETEKNLLAWGGRVVQNARGPPGRRVSKDGET